MNYIEQIRDALGTGDLPIKPAILHCMFFNLMDSSSNSVTDLVYGSPKSFTGLYKKLKKLRRRNFYPVKIDSAKLQTMIECLQIIHFKKHNYEQLRYEFKLKRNELFNILISKNQQCCCCGTTENLSIDHIKPLIKGGSNHISNLQIMCISCNSKKGSKWNN